MTLELYRNNEFVSSAGTTSGWGKLTRYVRTTDVRQYPNAHHLVEYGWARFAVEARQELTALLMESPPGEESTRTLLRHLVGALAVIVIEEKDTLAVTDGFS